MPPLAPGSTVGRYRLESTLGQGAMGVVYLALDPEIERRVAIKVVRAEGPGAAERQQEIELRFLKEAKIAGRLQHPNIVTIYDVGRDENLYFIAMEYVPGQALSRLLKPAGQLTDEQKLVLARQSAEALAHAHDRGVIHRDVKPGNILVREDGVVKVSDFGIGKFLTGDADLTQTGQMIGSPSYMSPEQIRGEKLDPRSDIFGLGVVLYEMFTGSRPFTGESVTSLVYQVIHKEPVDPIEIRPDMPPALAAILRRSLVKNREERYPDAHALVSDLRALSGLPAAPIVPAGGGAGAEAETGPGTGPGSGSHPGATSASTPTIIVEKRGTPALYFGAAALLLAAAAVIYVVTRADNTIIQLVPVGERRAPKAEPAPETGSTTASVSETTSATTSGPAEETSAGATQTALRETKTRESAAREAPAERTQASPAATAAAPSAAEAPPVDATYHTRRTVRFRISPDQARLYVDGTYVGIVDDWDNRGGGELFPFAPGDHHVRVSLPGYKDMHLDVVVSPSAKEDEVTAGGDMVHTGDAKYAKVRSVDYATLGHVIFSPDMEGVTVTLNGKPMGPAVQFTAAHMLELPGPMVHEFVLTGADHKVKQIRVLSASTAERDRVFIREKP
jgi:predicted Ser/Thr protein kinase